MSGRLGFRCGLVNGDNLADEKRLKKVSRRGQLSPRRVNHQAKGVKSALPEKSKSTRHSLHPIFRNAGLLGRSTSDVTTRCDWAQPRSG
jgi:hypothetical protein